MFFGLVDRKGRNGLGLVERGDCLILSPTGLLVLSLELLSDIFLILVLSKEIYEI